MIRNKPIGDLKQDKAISSAIYNMKGHVHTLAKLKQDMRSTVKKTNNHIIHLNMMMTLLIAVMALYFLAPSPTGFVVMDQEITSSENITLELDNLVQFYIESRISKDFSGMIYLNDKANRYKVMDYSISNLDTDVEGSTLDFEISKTYLSDKVAILNINSILDNPLLCTKWTINTEEICHGSLECCSFLNLNQKEDRWNETLYLNNGKYSATDRTNVKAQLYYANYSLNLSDAYSDIQYSNIKGAVVTLFDELNISICGEACSIDSSAINYTLEVLVESGHLHLDNYNYTKKLVSNQAPIFTSIPNITVRGNYSLDLSNYVSDLDGDSLVMSYHKQEGITIELDGLSAMIKANPGFIGTAFTFFIANDSNLIGISNIIELQVRNITQPRVIIGKPVKWVKKIAVVNKKAELEHEPINITVISNGKELDNSDIDIAINGTVKDLDDYEDDKRIELMNKEIEGKESKGIDVSELEQRRNMVQGEIVISKTGRALKKLVTAGITGNVILGEDNGTSLIIKEDVEEIEVEYYTEGPTAEEEDIENGKRVTISSDIHYEDILAYAFINDTAPELIKLHHISGNSKESVGFDGYDTNGDNLVDYIEWIVPHLSTEVYEITIIDISVDISVNEIVAENNFTRLNISGSAPYDDLVLYMPFDTNTSLTTVYDYSKFENDGAIMNAMYISSGKYGGAMSFDGDGDNITIPHSQNLNISGDGITISVWINLNEVARRQFVVGNFYNNYGWFLEMDNMDCGNGVMNFWSNINGSADQTCGQTALTQNRWYHVAAVYNSTHRAIYINATLDSNELDAGSIVSSIGFTSIGGRAGMTQNGRFFNGSIDEVMIFNKSLTASEISDIYNNQSSRFKSTGTQTLKSQNISAGNSQVKLNADFQTEKGTNISTRVGYWDISKGYNETDLNGNDGLVGYWHMDNSSIWCYQESANVSTACGGSNIGSYSYAGSWQNSSKFNDGDWDTFGYPWGTSATAFVNYTIPSGTTTYSLLQFKVANFSGSPEIFNYSIYPDCIASSPLELKFTQPDDVSTTFIFCKNKSSSNYITLGSYPRVDGVYEEAMWWNIENKTLDSSSNKHNGQLINDTILNNNAVFGNSFNFDGDGDYIDLGTIKNASSEAYSLWFKSTSSADMGFIRFNSGLNPSISRSGADSLVIVRQNQNYQTFSGISSYFDGQWHHLVATIPGPNKDDIVNAMAYIDGSSMSISSTNNASIPYTYSNFYIGSSSYGDFNGSIDEVMIFNRSLIAAEISELYTKGRAKFDYTTYQNLSTNGNTFTIGTSSTNVLSDFKFYSDSNNFYTPILQSSSISPLTMNVSGRIDSCINLTQANTVYTLQNDLNTNETCLTILANNIIIDMNGFNITGDDSGSTDYGVYSNGYNDSTIKNGEIYDFYTGIYLLNNQNNNITNMTANSNYYGIYLTSSSNNIITTNNITDNNVSGNGIYLTASDSNIISNNFGQNNRNGIILYTGSSENSIDNNNIINNHYNSIALVGSSNNNITNNNASGNFGDAGDLANSGSGIIIGWVSLNNLISDNFASDNKYNGIAIQYDSNGNIITNNTANSNERGILLFSNSNNNILTDNTANSNTNGIFLEVSSNHNQFIDGNASSNTNKDIYLTTTSINNTFLNVSYSLAKEYVVSSSSLIRKWYYKAYVNDTSGNNVSNGYILAYNILDNLVFNISTDSTGHTNQTAITEYVNNGGTRTYHSWYSFFANNGTYDYGVVSRNITGNLINETITVDGIRTCARFPFTASFIGGEDLTDNSLNRNCFAIAAENVSIDCKNYFIKSDDNYAAVYSNRYNLTLKNCNLSMSAGIGLKLEAANYSYIFNNTFDAGTIGLNISSGNNIDAINNTFTATTFDIYAADQGIKQYYFTATSLEVGDSNGILKFLNTSINAQGDNLSKIISISSNNVFINSSLDKGFNTSANITLYSISLTEPKAIADFDDDGTWEECPSSICVNLSYSGTTFIFNVTHFTSYGANESSSLFGCGELDKANTAYTLEKDLSTIGTCFNVTANNVTIDFAGYNITGNDSGVNYGIYSNGYNETTIMNGGIYDFYNGIYLLNNYGNNISDITANSNTNSGIYLDISLSNTLTNIVSNSNSQYGIYLLSSSNNTLTSNTFNSNIQFGVILSSSSNNTLTNNIVNSNDEGITLYSSSSNTIQDNTVNSNTFNGLYIDYGSNNNIINNSIWNCTVGGNYACIHINDWAQSNIFTDNRINLSGGYGIRIDADHNVFKNTNMTNINGRASIYVESGEVNNTFINFSYNNETIDSGGQIIRKWYYQAKVNDTNGNPIIANVTAYNVSGDIEFSVITNSSGWTEKQEITEYVNVGGTRTYYNNYTINATNSSYITTSKSLNVTTNNLAHNLQFDTSKVVECGNLSQANTIYTLQNNIITTENCFNITNNNISLDLNGYNITGDTALNDIGISIEGYNYTTIKNGGIYLFGIAINLENSNYNNITGLTVRRELTAGPGRGISLVSSSNNTITNNNVSNHVWAAVLCGVVQCSGIYLSSNSSGNLIENNALDYNFLGIWIDSSSNNSIKSNLVYNSGFQGVYLISSNSNDIINNTLIYHSNAIQLSSSSNENNLINNSIRNCTNNCIDFSNSDNNIVSGGVINLSDNYGISLDSTSDNNNISITSYQATAADAYIAGDNNRINGSFNSNVGIEVAASNKELILYQDSTFIKHGINVTENNVIINLNGYNLSGPNSGSYYGIYVNGYNETTIKDGWIYDFSNGIYLVSSDNNLIDNITSNSNSNKGILTVSSSNNVITNTTTNSNDVGIWLSGSSGNQLTQITASSNRGGWGTGIYVVNGQNNVIKDSAANSNQYYGIGIAFAANNTVVTNNQVVSNNMYGIFLQRNKNNTITNNIVNSSGSLGIYLTSSSNNTLINNTMNSQQMGFYLIFNSSNNTFINNNIWNCTYSCIVLSESDNNVFTDSTVNLSANYGVYLDSTSDNNNISISSYQATAADAYIAGDNNRINGSFNSNTGIVMAGASKTLFFLGDSIFEDYGINITANNVTLDLSDYNQAGKVAEYGIYSNGYNSSTIKNGRLSNFSFGLYLLNNIDNTIANLTLSDHYDSVVFVSSHNNLFINNLVEDSSLAAMWIDGSTNNTFKSNIINSSGTWGIEIWTGSDNSKIINNTLISSGQAIYLYQTSNNLIVNNTANENNFGIYLSQSSNNLIVNNTANSNINGIHFSDSSNNSAQNNTVNSNTWDSINIRLDSYNNTISNNNIWNCSTGGSYSCIKVEASDYNILENNKINLSSNYGIWIYSESSTKNSSHNIFKDMILENIQGTSIVLEDNLGSRNLNNTFINITYNNESVDVNSELTRRWYYQLHVNDTNKNNVANANVSFYAANNSLIDRLTTNSSGDIDIYEITEYVNKNNTITYFTPYTITASNSSSIGYHRAYNLTTNNLNDIITIDLETSSIDFGSNTPLTSSSQSVTSIYVNVSAIDSYSNISTFIDFDNSLISWWRMDDVGSVLGDINDYSSSSVTIADNWITCTDNYENLNCDDCAKSISINSVTGWNFSFYNESIDTVYMSDNGYLSLIDYSEGSYPFDPSITDLSAMKIIAPNYMDDASYSSDTWYCDGGDYIVFRWGNTDWGVESEAILYQNGNIEFAYEEPISINSDVGVSYGDGSYYTKIVDDGEIDNDYNLAYPSVVVDYMGRNNGNVVGNATQIEAGYFGKGFSFDGDGDYIDAGNDTSLDILGNITLSAWVYPLSYSEVSGERGIIYKDAGSNINYGITLGPAYSAEGRFAFLFSSGATNACVANDNITLNKWSHVVATYNKSITRLYVDSVLIKNCSQSNALTSNDASLIIGARSNAGTDSFNGTIDNAMIFNRSLTQNEIQALYANTSQKYVSNNFTNLAETTHSFKAYSQDTAGNVNETETRIITIEEGTLYAPSDTTTNNYTIEGTTDGTLSNASTYITDQSINFTRPSNGKRLELHALFSQGRVDLTNLTIEASETKTAVDTSTISGVSSNHTIFLPNNHGAAVYVCPDAKSLSDVNTTCPNIINFLPSEFGTWKNGIKVSIDGSNYRIENLTGSGAGEDNSTPYINFTSPTLSDGTTIANNWLFVNVSFNDSSNVSTFIDFDNSLVSWWRFDDINSSGDVIDYLSKINLSKIGSGSQIDSGKIGKGFNLTGSTYLENAGFDNTGIFNRELTTCVWLKPNIVATTGIINSIYGTSDWSLHTSGTNDNFAFETYNSQTITTYSGDNTLVAGNWHHACVTINSSNQTAFYINGILNQTNTHNFDSLDNGGNSLYVGVHPNGYFNGIIDDLLLFNRSLSATEVEALYANTSSKYVSNNFTSLQDGQHTITAYTQDVAGNVNSTQRTITTETGSSVTICRTLDQANTVYTLQKNINATGTCLTITANNITLDGNGYTITGSGTGTYYGINNTGSRKNITIKNFGNITKFKEGIYFDNVNDSLILNNTMISTITQSTYAIHLQDGDSNVIGNNSIEWGATTSSKSSYGVYFKINSGKNLGNNNFTGNNFNIDSVSSAAYGIFILNYGISNSNTFQSNIFGIGGSSIAYGISMTNFGTSMSSTTFQSNTFDIDSGSSYAAGIDLDNSGSLMSSNTFQSNTFDIDSTGSYAYGIYLFNAGASNTNTFYNETINTTSTASASDFRAYGIYLYNLDSSIISSIIVNATAESALASDIYLTNGASNNVFSNSTLLGKNWSVYVPIGGGTGNIFTNVSYSEEEFIDSGADLTRKWYYQAHVNDTNKNNVSNANVSIHLNNNSLLTTLITDLSGNTAIYEITEYTNNGGTKTYYTPYTITAINNTAVGFHRDYNITLSALDIITIDVGYPQISFASNTDSGTLGKDSIFINVSTTDISNISTFIDFDDSLVNWYRFDEGNGTTDFLGRNNGTLNGNASQTSVGKFGKGMSFDGDEDYIDFGNVENSLNGNFTWSIWIYLRKFVAGSAVPIINKAQLAAKGISFDITSGLTPTLRVIDWGAYTSVYSATILQTNTWYHAVITYDGTNITFYLDGNYDNSSTFSYNADTTSNLIAGFFGSVYANGTIDDILIFNRSLNQEEIQSLYANISSRYLTNNFTNLAETQHSFKAYSQDTAGNVNVTETRTVSIDTLAPSNIQLFSPTPTNYSSGQAQVTLNWTVTDNIDTTLDCYPVINNVEQSLISTQNNSFANTTLTLSGGINNISVRCYDNANNSNISEQRTYITAIINISEPRIDEIVRPEQLLEINLTILLGETYINNITIHINNGETTEILQTSNISQTIYNLTYNVTDVSPRYLNITAYAYNNDYNLITNITASTRLRLVKPSATTAQPIINFFCSNETYAINNTEVKIISELDLDTLISQANLTIILPNTTTVSITVTENNTDTNGSNNYISYFNFTYLPLASGTYTLTLTLEDLEGQTTTQNATLITSPSRTVNLSGTSVSSLNLKDICGNNLISNGATIEKAIPQIAIYNLESTMTLQPKSITLKNINITQDNTTNFISLTPRTNESDPPQGKRRIDMFDIESNMSFDNFTLVYNYTNQWHTLTDESNLDIYRCANLTNCNFVKQTISINTSTKTITLTRNNMSRYIITEPSLSGDPNLYLPPTISSINLSKTYTGINETINITLAFNISSTLNYVNLTINSTPIFPFKINFSGKRYHYYYTYTPLTLGTYIINATIYDENTFSTTASTLFYVAENTTTNLTSIGGLNITLKDINNNPLHKGETITETIILGKYNILVETNESKITLNNATINETTNSVLEFGKITDSITLPTYRQSIDQFEINSSLEYDQIEVVYNYTNITDAISDEDNIEIYKCENSTNCNWQEISEKTIDTDQNTITFLVNNLSIFLIAESYSVETQVVGEKRGGGLGSILLYQNKKVSLEIIPSSPLKMYSNDTIIARILVLNNGEIDFEKIIINITTDTTDLSIEPSQKIIDSLATNESTAFNVKIDSHTDPGVYEIDIIGKSESPEYTEKSKIIIELMGGGKTTEIERIKVVDKVKFAYDLFKENPECLEFQELITQADEAMNKGEHEKASALLESAINACKETITSMNTDLLEKRSPKGIDTTKLILIILALTLIIWLIMELWHRRIRRSTHISIKEKTKNAMKPRKRKQKKSHNIWEK